MFYSYFETKSASQRCVLAFEDHVNVTYLGLEVIGCKNTRFYNKAMNVYLIMFYALAIEEQETKRTLRTK
jgi:hypothetical protein